MAEIGVNGFVGSGQSGRWTKRLAQAMQPKEGRFWLRFFVSMQSYAPSPGAYTPSFWQDITSDLGSSGLYAVVVLPCDAPLNAAWRALGGNWNHYCPRSMNWRRVRPPLEAWPAILNAQRHLIQSMLEAYAASAKISLEAASSRLRFAYDHEPRRALTGALYQTTLGAGASSGQMQITLAGGAGANFSPSPAVAGEGSGDVIHVVEGSNWETFTVTARSGDMLTLSGNLASNYSPAARVYRSHRAINDGSIDGDWHAQAAATLPGLPGSIYLYSPTLWGPLNTLFDAYVEHFAAHSSLAYERFDAWAMTIFPNMGGRHDRGGRAYGNEVDLQITARVRKLRSKTRYGMNRKPIALHEIGVSPFEAGMVGGPGGVSERWRGILAQRLLERLQRRTDIDQGLLYTLMNDPDMDDADDRRYGFLSAGGELYHGAAWLARVGGNRWTAVPQGFTNFGGNWRGRA